MALKLSQAFDMSELRDVRTLVIDPAGHSKNLLRSLLANLGVMRVAATPSTEEALQILRAESFSVVFCDELAGPLDPLAFLKSLRRDLSTRDVTIPVVLVSAGADISKIKAARDAGMNDVIAKPVSLGTVERKLRSLIIAPRPFVTAKKFVGPDRRGTSDDRRQFGERPPGGEDRRGRSETGTVFTVGSRLSPEEPMKS
jgi:two-component system chemotaxis response regulator CheY